RTLPHDRWDVARSAGCMRTRRKSGLKSQGRERTWANNERSGLFAIPRSERHRYAVLKRSLGLVHATALVVGIIVGASIFVQPSAIAASVPRIGAVNAVWIAAGLLTLCGALIAAELSTAFPKAGGVYVFLSEAFSPGVAF